MLELKKNNLRKHFSAGTQCSQVMMELSKLAQIRLACCVRVLGTTQSTVCEWVA